MLTTLALIAVALSIVSETCSFADPTYRRYLEGRPGYIKVLGVLMGIVIYAILAIILF